MILPLQFAVRCTDGPCGRMIAVILDPKRLIISHLVVHEPGRAGITRMVPFELAGRRTVDALFLNCNRARLQRCTPFLAREIVSEYVTRNQNLQYGWYWPQDERSRPPEKRFVSVVYEQTPKGEVSLQRNAHVEATDGRAGIAKALLVGPDGRITHLVLRHGHIWEPREVTVDSAYIEYVGQTTVYLNLTRRQIEQLPAEPVRPRIA